MLLAPIELQTNWALLLLLSHLRGIGERAKYHETPWFHNNNSANHERNEKNTPQQTTRKSSDQICVSPKGTTAKQTKKGAGETGRNIFPPHPRLSRCDFCCDHSASLSDPDLLLKSSKKKTERFAGCGNQKIVNRIDDKDGCTFHNPTPQAWLHKSRSDTNAFDNSIKEQNPVRLAIRSLF